jgi:membrane protein DedA with SNARE-associated domain
MTDYIHAIVHFAEVHANWIYVIAFAAALLESVAVVGFLVPGSGIIIAIGALIPSGAVGFWWLCLWSILGALGGDSISYWAGHHYGDRLRRLWPFSRHPEVLTHGERFFARHGGKSVFLARFVAPVRGAVPLVAGLARLSPGRFLVANATSALGWAPAHIILGMLIGAGLTLTNAVATRLLVFTVVLALLLWLAVRITVLAVRRGLPLLNAAQEKIDAWARGRSGRFARQVLALVDASRPESRTLAVFGLVLIGAVWIFLAVLEDVVTGDPLVRADAAIYSALQGLRSLVTDRIMIGITELGGSVVVGAVTGTVLLWLIWRRAWHTAAYWVAAVGGASVIGLVIKVALHRFIPGWRLSHSPVATPQPAQLCMGSSRCCWRVVWPRRGKRPSVPWRRSWLR